MDIMLNLSFVTIGLWITREINKCDNLKWFFELGSVLLRYGGDALNRVGFKRMSVVLHSGAGFPEGVAPTK